MNSKKPILHEKKESNNGGKPLNESFTPPVQIRTTKPKKEEPKKKK